MNPINPAFAPQVIESPNGSYQLHDGLGRTLTIDGFSELWGIAHIITSFADDVRLSEQEADRRSDREWLEKRR